MNKILPLFLGLMLPLASAFAQQDSAAMNAANKQIIDVCKKEGGVFISHADSKCSYVGCAYIGDNNLVGYKGNNERIDGCSSADLAKYRTLAQRDYKSEIDRAIADEDAAAARRKRDLEARRNAADGIGGDTVGGPGSTAGAGSSGGAGDGVPAPGSRGPNTNVGVSQGGARSGNGGDDDGGYGDGNGNGQHRGRRQSDYPRTSDDISEVECREVLQGGRIGKNMPCYKQCKPVKTGVFAVLTLGIFGKTKEGLERKKCVQCLYGYSDLYTLQDNIRDAYEREHGLGKYATVAGGYGGGGGGRGKEVFIGGVGIRTGVIICKDRNGRVVSTLSSGSCPSGSAPNGNFANNGSGNGNGNRGNGNGNNGNSNGNGPVSGNNGNGNGNGNVNVSNNGSVGGNINVNGNSPGAISGNGNVSVSGGGRFGCSSSTSTDACLAQIGGGVNGGGAMYDANGNCINCAGRRDVIAISSRPADNIWSSGLFPSLFGAVGQIGGAYFNGRAIERSNQAWANSATAQSANCWNAHRGYLAQNAAAEGPIVTPEQWQNMSCDSYAGYNSAAMIGLNGAGYSNGFIGGLYGPYGYGAGLNSGFGGLGGLPGLGGGFGGSIGFGGSLGGIPGYGGGFGGLPGYAGNIGIGVGGVGGIPYNGGFAGGLAPGYGYGYGNGLGLNGQIGFNAGLGGVPGLGYGGVPQLGYGGYGSGTIPYGYGGNGYLGAGNYYGNTMNGGLGYGYGGLQASQQASSMDRMYQQQGLQYQNGMMNSGANFGNGGYANYGVGNIAAGASFGFNLGM